MIRSGVALASVLCVAGGCRGEAAAPSEPPPAGATAPSAPVVADRAARETPEEPPMTTTPAPSPAPTPPGPALAPEAVVPHFQRWWAAWSKEHLAAHPLRVTLDERVAAGGTRTPQACDALAEHVRERAPLRSPELLHGDPAALRGRTDRCWWLHHDGLMGPGLGAALASDGQVLAVWVVREG